NGGLVVFPTETVYGLGADATSSEAARKIYSAKGRPSDNPLIIHISSPGEAEIYTETSPLYYKLAERFMPGPLTVIMKAKPTVPFATRGGLSTVAVRCPENPIANALIKKAAVAIAAPSANLSGSPSPTSASHAISDMMGRVDMIIDGGACEIGIESTIVKIEDDGSLTLLRPGKITVEELLTVADVVSIAGAVTDKLKSGERALSPGMKYRHYAPRCELVLIDGDRQGIADYVLSQGKKRLALIAYDEDIAFFEAKYPELKIMSFGPATDETEQAKRLFSLLRECDGLELDLILAPLPTPKGMGLALYNRMIHAAAHQIIKCDGEING
ncbi:MAG: threonylcarbamoyl-AMP synthase, partial [Clostridia bacterium]|nr:threonylcarbamoyl-AMP synthase [Clostridia bacterium]